jgi:nucleotide-binding universal stress UspA family protein
MLEKIVVPLDRSPLAECVLPHAIAVAHALDARLILLHVLSVPDRQNHSRAVDPLEWHLRRAEAESYLQEVRERLRQGGVAVETSLLEGDAAERILEFSRENQVGLAIMSSHGQSGLSGWNVSSIVQKVIMRALTSFMIVRACQPAQADILGLRYRRMLVPLDTSARAESVLPLAAALARASDAQVVLAHVVQRPQMPRRTPPSREDSELAERIVELNRGEAERYLDEVRTQFPAGAVRTRLLIGDHVAAAVHELADQEQADLVLLSAHGSSGEMRWPYGGLVASFVAFGSSPLLIFQDAPLEPAAPSLVDVAAANYGSQ